MLLRSFARAAAGGMVIVGSSLLLLRARKAPKQRSARCQAAAGCGASASRGIVLFTDLDGTLVISKEEQKQSEARLREFNKFWETERAKGSILVYNTARSIRMYEQLASDYSEFQPPDVLITGEGTEIRWLVAPEDSTRIASHGHTEQGVHFLLDSEWDERIQNHWWESGLRGKVVALMEKIDDGCFEGLNDKANGLGRYESRHAITLQGGPGSENLANQTLQKLHEKLNCDGNHVVDLAGFPAWGEDPKPQIITALPSIAGKANAARYVAQKLGFSENQCVGAGDTMGDASMLDAGEISFFAVANADEALKQAIAKEQNHGFRPFPCTVRQVAATGVVEGTQKFRVTNFGAA